MRYKEVSNEDFEIIAPDKKKVAFYKNSEKNFTFASDYRLEIC